MRYKTNTHTHTHVLWEKAIISFWLYTRLKVSRSHFFFACGRRRRRARGGGLLKSLSPVCIRLRTRCNTISNRFFETFFSSIFFLFSPLSIFSSRVILLKKNGSKEKEEAFFFIIINSSLFCVDTKPKNKTLPETTTTPQKKKKTTKRRRRCRKARSRPRSASAARNQSGRA